MTAARADVLFLNALARDAGEFKEGDHPRRDDGKFGSGSGGVSKSSETKPEDRTKPTQSVVQNVLGPEADYYMDLAKSAVAKTKGRLDQSETALVLSYMDEGYVDLNKGLRAGNASEKVQQYAVALKSALEKMPKYKGVVTRSANLPAEAVVMYEPGSLINERAFLSTGIDYEFEDMGQSFEIASKSGRNISALNEDQQEVIFLPKTWFKVVSNDGKKIVLAEM